jgi:hypothetical protein
MKHYKSPNNEIYAYEADGSQDHVIPKDYVAITDSEVDQIRTAQVQAKLDALTYAQKRRAEYPPVTDYLDAVVKDDQAAIAAYIAACQAVKAKYPKS